ncbi:MAG: efflux RND transporter permease subunit [Desulfovibrionaceae bacterium]|nr:efflux RND transporter permease subunit [Desulfovibrionaceae bacterium]
MARFFIDRPIFAWVIAILIMLCGLLSVWTLPVAQYPPVAPPAITITCDYPGASAQTLEDSVTQIIEQKMTGLDNLLYMASSSDGSGHVEITLTFANGTNPDTAQVQVQNKLSLAEPLLPDIVKQMGITVEKTAMVFLKIYALHSPTGRYNDADLADYLATNIQDAVGRLSGVGQTTIFGSQYAMRIWMDPHKLQSYGLMPSDILNAISAQNAQMSAGQLGAAPAADWQKNNLAIALQERLNTPEDFRNVILKTKPDGSEIRIRDVARVEMGSESYNIFSRFNTGLSTALAVKLATGANALDTVAAIDAYLEKQRPFFPEGIECTPCYDSTPFVRLSIEQVVHTLIEAIVLVVAIVFLFLQNWRATLIPTIAVPVVLLGTFGVLAAFGYSINTLTMFGMVLAIGLLVDDAIVVVENVERVMKEEHLPPLEATRRSMDQITGALIGIAMVLAAVFVPMSFMSGSVGTVYRQFSVTVVAAMTLSVIVAIILTPALCATMLKPHEEQTETGFFGWFNRMFNSATNAYRRGVAGLLSHLGRMVLIYLLLIGGAAFLFRILPTGFLPDEDQGSMFVSVQLPPTATQMQTSEVMSHIEKYLLEEEKDTVDVFQAIIGFSFAGRGQNNGMIFVTLKDWSLRKKKEQSLPMLIQRVQQRFASVNEARIFAFQPPAMMELGNATGFDLMLQDRGALGHDVLLQARNKLLGMASQHPGLMAVRPNGLDDQAQMRVVIDRKKLMAQGLSLAEVNSALSIAWGSSYIDDFLDRGRVKKVYIQGDARFRSTPEDMNQWYFRNSRGQMVPFASFASCSWESAPIKLDRYNGLPAMEILGAPAPGKSTGEAMAIMEELISHLPSGIGYEWTGISYQERQAGSQTLLLYTLSILVVFLCLAALYESWSVPFAVILVVPIGVLGALAGCWLGGHANDVYFQVGLLATIGLSAKNAILIVEFAKDLTDKGVALSRAVVLACRMRLRPILMTSFAFLLGIMPLMLTKGAGSGGQNALGTGVFSGTLTATALGIFFIPIFYVVVTKIFSGDWMIRKNPGNTEDRQ